MGLMNRLANSKNHYQGDTKKVLAVCNAGLLRSPTIAWLLSQAPWEYNTRAAGISQEYALILVDDVLLNWANEIVCAAQDHADVIKADYPGHENKTVVLGLPDIFPYRDPELVQLITDLYGTGEPA